MVTLPRIVIAAPGSGHGKTTVATGLMAALAAAGHTVSGHKVGPDYIDPGYHALATGRPGRNLDPHLVGEDLVTPLLLHGAGTGTAEAADLAVIEGVMGLFDGQLGSGGFASTAHVAALTSSPVILVVDASHASRSIGAVAHGLATFDPSVRVAGVIVNKVGSDRHAAEVCSSIPLPVLGVLGRHDQVEAPSRHLGLVPATEREESRAALEKLAAIVSERIDLAAVADIARTAPALEAEPWRPADHVTPVSGSPVVAVAGGRAFTFRYAETTELLEAAGARVEVFDPLNDELPAGTAGLYLGGGFPEVHAAELTSNTRLLGQVREAVQDGVPTVAECAGLLYLCRSLDGAPMAGAIDAEARMTPRLTLAYRRARAAAGSIFGDSRVTAHEFHRTVVEPVAGSAPAWQLDGGGPAGWSTPTMSASYLHVHWAGQPHLARALLSGAPSSPASGALSSRLSACRDETAPLATKLAPLAAGRVTLVSAGPGDPGLMTVAGRDALGRADVVITDRLVPRQALEWIAPQAEIIDVAKIPYGAQTSQERINELLVEHARLGRDVVRLKGGDAFVFGRGGEEVDHCSEAGIETRVIAGVSSSIAAPGAAGIPVTHRGLTQGFAVVSGHLPPGHPESTVNWPALAAGGLTIVVMMGVRQLPAIAAALAEAGMDPSTPAAVIADGTLPTQRVVTAPLAGIADAAREAGIGPPAVTVIGPTVPTEQEHS